MIQPAILSDAVLGQARLWENACQQRWAEPVYHLRIGEAPLPSLLDLTPRKVVLYLVDDLYCSGVRVKGRTGFKTPLPTDGIVEEYQIALNKAMLRPALNDLMPVLLHEITHAIDPYFDKDIRRQNPPGEPPIELSSQEQYELPSEQRAFAAMWTAALQEDIKAYKSSAVSGILYCYRSSEFKSYWLHSESTRDLAKAHIRLIVADLKRR